jgi:hypothetical protein
MPARSGIVEQTWRDGMMQGAGAGVGGSYLNGESRDVTGKVEYTISFEGGR